MSRLANLTSRRWSPSTRLVTPAVAGSSLRAASDASSFSPPAPIIEVRHVGKVRRNELDDQSTARCAGMKMPAPILTIERGQKSVLWLKVYSI